MYLFCFDMVNKLLSLSLSLSLSLVTRTCEFRTTVYEDLLRGCLRIPEWSQNRLIPRRRNGLQRRSWAFCAYATTGHHDRQTNGLTDVHVHGAAYNDVM